MNMQCNVIQRLAKLVAHSGCVILLQETEFSYHFSSRFHPWVHYVPLSNNLADATEKVEWLQQHDDMARQLALNARAFGRSYLRLEDYLCYIATALKTLEGFFVKDKNSHSGISSSSGSGLGF